MKIAIDIGHAKGTGSKGNGLDEHDSNLEIGKILKCLFCKNGFNVEIVDFENDSNSSDLNKTIAYVNAQKFDYIISLHHDCSENKNARGSHCCYISNTGKKLAQAISTQLNKILTGRSELVVKRDNLAILKKTNGVAVLVESGFQSNVYDVDIINSSRDKIAQAIFEGFREFI